MDIAAWLRTLKLDDYVNAFFENEIDADVLPSLTADDLKDLGILKVGHRRRLLDAIGELRAEPLVDTEATQTPNQQAAKSLKTAPSAPDAGSQSAEAERRHLTVMFVDLVGSTELAAGLDPEEMRNIVTSYQNTIAGVVARYDGYVAKFMGDGVLCYFGWPNAHEDDAERATRAGLDAIAGVHRLTTPTGSSLAARIGIATGIVVVGDLVGSGASQEAAVVGSTPNLAARLQTLAKPDMIAVSAETRALLGEVFDLDDLGTHKLKGFADPVAAFAIVGENTRQSRFESRQGDRLGPIVGREHEIALILEAWHGAVAGKGRMVLVSGEAGIGKSRITRAALDEIAREDHRRITYQCSPYHTESAFHPIIQAMVHSAGFQATDGNDARLDKLETAIADDGRTAALAAALIGLDGGARYGALGLTPAQQRAQTMAALIGVIEREAAQRPLLIVFEDLHWIDPTTLELLELTLDSIADRRVLILSTARPVFGYAFGGHPVFSRLTLNRLGADQIRSVVDCVTEGRPLPEEVIDIIIERTDGVPLFVEELTKTILESGVLRADGDRMVLTGPLEHVAIPHTLHDSLMARLDRLQPVKEVAQMAACIGREFGHGLLAGVTLLPEVELLEALDRLIAAELIYRRGLPPDAIYLFKHALVRDAAYESLLRERRRAIHARILDELARDPDVAPELAAHHAEEAGLTDRAIDLWDAASAASIARPAYDEGIAQLRHTLALVGEQIDRGTPDSLERALGLQVRLGNAHLARTGYSAEATKKAFEQALALADRVGETPLRFAALYGLWVGMYARGNFADAERLAADLVALTESATETAAHVVSLRVMGVSLLLQGKVLEALVYLEHALSLFDPEQHGRLENRFGQDIGAAIYLYLSISFLLMGRIRDATTHADEATRFATQSGHANTICYTAFHRAIMGMMTEDPEAVRRHLDIAQPLATEHRLTFWTHYCAAIRELDGIAASGETPTAGYENADGVLTESGNRIFFPLLKIEAARRALARGHGEWAREMALSARDMMAETGDRIVLPDWHRLTAALALDAGEPDVAETELLQAIAVADRQGSGFLGLRAAIDLARLRLDQGRPPEAAACLGPALDGLADDDCPDEFAAARQLLARTAG